MPEALLNGDPSLSVEGRLPGNAHFSFPGCEGDALLLLLDAREIECSTGIGVLGRGRTSVARAARDGS